MIVRVHKLTKIIQGRTVLDNINISFSNATDGKIYGIQGINGSGKTMLMRLISGLVLPTSGEVSIDNKIIGKDISFPESLGLLLENPVFIDEFTGFKNLKLLCGLRNIASSDQIRQTMQSVGLSPDDSRIYRKYSLGMKQRLGIACAIVESPDLILLDEPFNALDENGIEMVQGLIRKVKQEGKLIIFTCHDQDLLQSLADEIIKMSDGKIIE